jgi:hypothetical protein
VSIRTTSLTPVIELIADFRAWCAGASGWVVPSFCGVARGQLPSVSGKAIGPVRNG